VFGFLQHDRNKVRLHRLSLEGHAIIAESAQQSWSIPLADITCVSAYPMPSLCDELGFTIIAGREFFFDETDPGALDVIEAMEPELLFGPGWYRRAELGWGYVHDGPLPEHILNT